MYFILKRMRKKTHERKKVEEKKVNGEERKTSKQANNDVLSKERETDQHIENYSLAHDIRMF